MHKELNVEIRLNERPAILGYRRIYDNQRRGVNLYNSTKY